MNYVLILDDDPGRCLGLVKLGYQVKLCGDVDQLRFWLAAPLTYQGIMLDHDLGKGYNGHQIVKSSLGSQLVAAYCPIRIWSNNNIGAANMKVTLDWHLGELGITDHPGINVVPYGKSQHDIWGYGEPGAFPDNPDLE